MGNSPVKRRKAVHGNRVAARTARTLDIPTLVYIRKYSGFGRTCTVDNWVRTRLVQHSGTLPCIPKPWLRAVAPVLVFMYLFVCMQPTDWANPPGNGPWWWCGPGLDRYLIFHFHAISVLRRPIPPSTPCSFKIESDSRTSSQCFCLSLPTLTTHYYLRSMSRRSDLRRVTECKKQPTYSLTRVCTAKQKPMSPNPPSFSAVLFCVSWCQSMGLAPSSWLSCWWMVWSNAPFCSQPAPGQEDPLQSLAPIRPWTWRTRTRCCTNSYWQDPRPRVLCASYAHTVGSNMHT